MDTNGFGGKRLSKNVSVQSNDPKHPRLILTIAGFVEAIFTMKPSRVRLVGRAGEQIKASVTIIPETKYSFKVVDVEAEYGEHISYSYSQIKAAQGKGYILTVENQKKEAGRYRDTIQLKTDSKLKPNIKVYVYGNIYDAPQKGKKKP